MTKKISNKSLRMVFVLAGMATSHAALAQGTQSAPLADGETMSGDEIVVTAQKREESLQNVPISITAISTKDLQDRNIRDLSDISAIAPSLSIQGEENGRATIVIRGLTSGGTPGDKVAVSETVGIYFDDIPVSLALRSPDLRPVDLARVEVLRGPQGTLYGGGALGGAIKYVAAAPDYNDVQFAANADLNTTRHGGFGNNLDATVNLPIMTDKLAVRVVGYNSFEPGFVNNILLNEKHAGDRTVRGFRAQVGFRPVEAFELIGKVIFQNTDYGPGSSVVQRDRPAFLLPAGRTLGGLEQAARLTEEGRDRFRLYNLTGTLDLGFAQLYSSTSRIIRNNYSARDVSYLTEQFFDPRLTFLATEEIPVRQWIQEVRLTSNGSGPFRWVVGGFYTTSTRLYNADGPSPGFSALIGLDSRDFGGFAADNIYSARNRIEEKQKALFGEASYDVGKFTLTAGGRLFDQRQTYDLLTVGVFNGGIISGQTKAEGNGFNPRFIASYQADPDIKISAQASKGFRLGGGNDTIPVSVCGVSGPRAFGEESVWSYELNAKMKLAGGRITFNPAVFRTDYKDIQVIQTLACGYNFITNGGTARSQGAEVDASFRLSDNFILRGGLSYTDAKLTSPPPAGVVGNDGDRLPLSSRWTANGIFRYEQDVSDWRLYAQTDVRYQSNVIQRLGGGPGTTVPGRAMVGARIGANFDKAELAFYVDNVFDSRAKTTAIFINGRGFDYGVERPRQIGVSLSYRY